MVESQDKGDTSNAGSFFHERLARRWSAGYQAGGFKRRKVFLMRYLAGNVRAGDVWLDVGCGSGVFSRELSSLGAKVVAVDGSQSMIDSAISETNFLNHNITYKKINTVEELDEDSNSFNGVLCSSVLEYIDSPSLALHELSRVAKPNGIVIVSVPNRYSLVRNLQKVIKFIGRCINVNMFEYIDVSINDYGSSDIENILKLNGLYVKTIKLFDPLIPSVLGGCFWGSLIFLVTQKNKSHL